VVTPKTLEEFHGETLVLPNVTTLGDSEKQALRQFASNGGRLVITGSDVTGLALSTHTVRFENCPGKVYFEKLSGNFSEGCQEMPKDFLQALVTKSEVNLEAPPTVAANFGLIDGAPHLFIANFSGLVPGKVAVPTVVSGAKISIPAAAGNSLAYLPFLGQAQILHGTKHSDTIHGDTVQFDLPPIERGAVAWAVAN